MSKTNRKYQEQLDYISYQDIWDLKCKDNLTNDKRIEIDLIEKSKVIKIGKNLYRLFEDG